MKKTILYLSFLASFVVNANERTFPASELIENYKLNAKASRQFSTESQLNRFGVKWNTNGTCGDFDMDFSIAKTLSSQDLQRMMDNWITQAKNAFDPASLIALALQRANPDLYEILMNGVIEARGIYEKDSGVCESIQNTILDSAPDGGVNKLAIKEEYTKQVTNAYNENSQVAIGDMVDFVQGAGKEGFEILGDKYGGENQPEAKVTALAAQAGFASFADKTSNGEVNVNDTSPVSDTPQNLDKYPFIKYFTSYEEVTDYVTSIVGETSISSDKGENPYTFSKGIGLSKPLKEKESDYIQKITELRDLAENSPLPAYKYAVDEFNKDNPSTYLTVDMVAELARTSDGLSNSLIRSLAQEYAFKFVIEKTFFARRIIFRGSKETSIYTAEPIRSQIEEKIEMLDKEIELFETQQRITKLYAVKASEMLYERAIKRNMQGGSFNFESGITQ
jgi:integrating conjugative element protein (TIGR03755 family)